MGSTPPFCSDLQAKQHLDELLTIQDAIACLICCLPGTVGRLALMKSSIVKGFSLKDPCAELTPGPEPQTATSSS